MRPKSDLGRPFERGLHGGALMHQVDAVAVRITHPLNRLRLVGDSAKARTDGFLLSASSMVVPLQVQALSSWSMDEASRYPFST